MHPRPVEQEYLFPGVVYNGKFSSVFACLDRTGIDLPPPTGASLENASLNVIDLLKFD